MQGDRQAEAADIVRAGRVLARHGLVTAFGHVSVRAGQHMVITPASDLADATLDEVVQVELDATVLPPEAPAEAWAHLRVYAARPEVNAIARAQPPAAFAVAAVTSVLRPLHGQACWIGDQVPVHDNPRLLRSAELADAAAATLGESDGLLLRGNGALTCAANPGEAVARMWLLAAACQAWLAATASAATIAGAPGQPKEMSADEVASWRAAGPALLPRLWLHLSRDVP